MAKPLFNPAPDLISPYPDYLHTFLTCILFLITFYMSLDNK